MVTKAKPIHRGCGASRTRGGVYAELGLGAGGAPVEEFLIDPPIPVPEDLGLASIGIKLIERDGIWHLLDHVGSMHYPNLADYVEEVKRAGVSRRLPRSLAFHKISAESRLILAHARAWIDNAEEYQAAREAGPRCPCGVIAHTPQDYAGMCAGLWWDDVEGGERTDSPDPRHVTVHMPSFDYVARLAPPGVEPRYREAFFASFPLSRLVVIRDADDRHKPALEAASAAGLLVEEEDE